MIQGQKDVPCSSKFEHKVPILVGAGAECRCNMVRSAGIDRNTCRNTSQERHRLLNHSTQSMAFNYRRQNRCRKACISKHRFQKRTIQ